MRTLLLILVAGIVSSTFLGLLKNDMRADNPSERLSHFALVYATDPQIMISHVVEALPKCGTTAFKAGSQNMTRFAKVVTIMIANQTDVSAAGLRGKAEYKSEVKRVARQATEAFAGAAQSDIDAITNENAAFSNDIERIRCTLNRALSSYQKT